MAEPASDRSLLLLSVASLSFVLVLSLLFALIMESMVFWYPARLSSTVLSAVMKSVPLSSFDRSVSESSLAVISFCDIALTWGAGGRGGSYIGIVSFCN